MNQGCQVGTVETKPKKIAKNQKKSEWPKVQAEFVCQKFTKRKLEKKLFGYKKYFFEPKNIAI